MLFGQCPKIFLLHFFMFWDILSNFSQKKFFWKFCYRAVTNNLEVIRQCQHSKGMIMKHCWQKSLQENVLQRIFCWVAHFSVANRHFWDFCQKCFITTKLLNPFLIAQNIFSVLPFFAWLGWNWILWRTVIMICLFVNEYTDVVKTFLQCL